MMGARPGGHRPATGAQAPAAGMLDTYRLGKGGGGALKRPGRGAVGGGKPLGRSRLPESSDIDDSIGEDGEEGKVGAPVQQGEVVVTMNAAALLRRVGVTGEERQ